MFSKQFKISYYSELLKRFNFITIIPTGDHGMIRQNITVINVFVLVMIIIIIVSPSVVYLSWAVRNYEVNT